jgi:hypothetical protein
MLHASPLLSRETWVRSKCHVTISNTASGLLVLQNDSCPVEVRKAGLSQDDQPSTHELNIAETGLADVNASLQEPIEYRLTIGASSKRIGR